MNRTRKGSAASISSSTASKGRGTRRQRNRGKIRAGRWFGYSSSKFFPHSFLKILLYQKFLWIIITVLCSPGEEMALVEHLKGMSLTSGAKRELKSLLVSLVMLGKEEIAKKLQRTGEAFQLSQMAAVKLAEDTIPNNIIDEHAHTLEHYVHKLRSEQLHSDAFVWQYKVLVSS